MKNDISDNPNQAYKYCFKCGNKLFEEAEICPKCGVRQPSTKSTTNSRYNKLTAALLAIFLGFFGAHKFYLGKTIQGFFYLILFWTGLPLILGFLEGLVYLSTTQEDFDRKYNPI